MSVSATKSYLDNSPWIEGEILKQSIKEKKKITSSLFQSSSQNKFQKILDGAIPFGYGYYNKEEFDEATQKNVIRRVRKEDKGPNVKLLQQALYIYYLELSRLTDYDLDTPLQQFLYNGQKKLANGEFTGVFDLETEIYVSHFQSKNLIVGIPKIPTSSEERWLKGYGIPNANVINALDFFLTEIKYYDFQSDKPFIYHNNSLCLDGNMSLMTVANQDGAYVYKLPNENSTKLAKLTTLKSKVYVLQDISNYRAGWLYVQIDFNSSTENNTGHGITGYVEKSKFLLRNNAPDAHAVAYKVKYGETPYSIIRDHYYHKSGEEWYNSRGLKLRTHHEETLDFLLLPGISINVKEANQFKFYMNLLLFANNKYGILPPGETSETTKEAIYLLFPESQNAYSKTASWDWEDMYAKTCPFLNQYTFLENDSNQPPDPNNLNNLSNYTNYEYFLDKLKSKNAGFHWDWDDNDNDNYMNNVMRLIADKYIWIPSKQFADSLYAYINQDIDYLHEIADATRNALREVWPRGFGLKIEGDIGATFGIPLRLEAGGSVYIQRVFTESDEDFVIRLSKSGRLRGGVDFGAGAGFYVGSGTKQRPDYGLGAQVFAGIGAGGEFNCTFEYEFALVTANLTKYTNYRSSDLAVFALLTSVFSTIGGSLEFTVLQLAKAFTDFNFDPNNYLVNADVSALGYVQGSAGAFAGIKFGDPESIDYWKNPTANQPNNPANPPWLLKNLMSKLNASLNADFSVELGVGFVYEAQYDEMFDNVQVYGTARMDFNTGARVPRMFSIKLKTNLSYMANVGGGSPLLGSLQLVNIDEEYEFSYIRNYIINDSNYTRKYIVEDNGAPQIGFSCENTAKNYEFGLLINVPENLPEDFDDMMNLINSISFKKTIPLADLSKNAPENILNSLDSLKRFFSNRDKFQKWGAGIAANIELECSVTGEDFTGQFIPDFLALVQAIRNEIAIKANTTPENINWLQVIVEFPQYLSVFSSESVTEEALDLYHTVLEVFKIINFAFHGELYFGFAAGFKIGQGLKAALDGRFKVTFSYDQSFMRNNQWLIPFNDDSEPVPNEKSMARQLSASIANKTDLVKFAIYKLVN